MITFECLERCMNATLVAAVVNRLAGSSDNEAAVAGANLAIGLAADKEYGDSKAIGNKWNWHDIAADGAGILLPHATACRYG